jgi:hypothetical protein
MKTGRSGKYYRVASDTPRKTSKTGIIRLKRASKRVRNLFI